MFKGKEFGFACFLVMVFCFSFISKGQSIDYGLKIGLNVSNQADKFQYSGNTYTPESAFGYQVGGIIRTDLNNSLRAAFEPSLIKLGANYTESISLQGQEAESHSRTDLWYLHLPLLIQHHKQETTSDLSFNFSAGLFGEYLLNAKFKGENIVNDTVNRFSEDIINQFSKYDAGVIYGMGVEWNEKIGLETRFQYTFLQSYQGEPQFKPKNFAFKLSISLYPKLIANI